MKGLFDVVRRLRRQGKPKESTPVDVDGLWRQHKSRQSCGTPGVYFPSGYSGWSGYASGTGFSGYYGVSGVSGWSGAYTPPKKVPSALFTIEELFRDERVNTPQYEEFGGMI